MKKPSNQLFQFIRSLDPFEKAFVKNSFSAHYQNTNTEKLFDYLCECVHYDETILLQSLPFLSRITIKHAKQNLFDYVLKKLDQYYAGTDEEQQLQRLLFQVKILRRKKFYKKAYQLLALGISRAEEYDLILLQVQMQLEQKHLLGIQPDLVTTQGCEQDPVVNIDVLLHHFREEYFATTAGIEIASFTLSAKKTQNETERRIRYFYEQAVAKKQERNYVFIPDNIKLKIDFIEFNCLRLLHDDVEAKKCFLALFKRAKKINLKTSVAKEQFLINLVGGSAISSYCKDEKLLLAINKKADELIDTFQAKEINTLIANQYFAIKGNLIHFLIKKNDFEAAKRESEELVEKINMSSILFVYQKIFLTNLTGIYLFCGQVRKALNTYNLIITDPQLNNIRVSEGETTYGANVLALAIYYDLKLWSNLKSFCGSCKRDKDFVNQVSVYKLLIDFFDMLIKVKDTAAIKKLFENMANAINSIVKQGQDADSIHFLGMLEIRYWLTCKLKELSTKSVL